MANTVVARISGPLMSTAVIVNIFTLLLTKNAVLSSSDGRMEKGKNKTKKKRREGERERKEKRKEKKEKKEKKSLETSERAKARKPRLIQSLGEEIGDIVVGIDIRKRNFAAVHSLTQKVMTDVEMFGT